MLIWGDVKGGNGFSSGWVVDGVFGVGGGSGWVVGGGDVCVGGDAIAVYPDGVGVFA